MLLLFLDASSYCQVPGVKWSKRIASTVSNDEYIYEIQPTSDKGFVMVGADTGFSFVPGLLMENNEFGRPWILKADSSGNVIWKKVLETVDPHRSAFTSVAPAADGGFVAVGVEGGFPDTMKLLIAKFNSSGIFQWQKLYGGSKNEIAHCIKRTSTNGFIIAGTTTSNDGDVTDNHNTGSGDVWVLRINDHGDIIWKKCYGGTGGERGRSVVQTADYGFVFVGSATSNNGDLTGNLGGIDGWIFKTDSSGNLLWQKNLGTSSAESFNCATITADNSIAVTGYVNQTTTITNGDKPLENLWVVKLDQSGTVTWSKAYGGSSFERGVHILPLINNTILVTGHTRSNDMDVSGNNGGSDIWVLNLLPDGILKWQKCIGTDKGEWGFGVAYLTESDFFVAGVSESPATTETDGYMVRLGNSNTIKGVLYYDVNSNGVRDVQEPGFNYASVKTQNGQEILSAQPVNGLFKFDADLGTYTTTIQFNNPYFNTVPVSGNSNFTTYFNTDSFGFAIQPIPNKQDLQINLVPLSPARPGFKAQYVLNYKNVGTTTIANGSVKLIKDSRAALSLALSVPASIIADTLTWNYSNLKPLDSIAIGLEFQLAAPPALNINDTLKYTAVILPVAGDLTPADDTSSLRQRVIGSYDPNDKQESFAGKIPLKNVQDGSYINYVIRFQNTGNDTAFFVRLLDTLDTKLDWNSFQMIGSSHSYNLTIKDGNKLNWFFDNIKLPDSTTNRARSIGYVAFRIKPKNTLVANEVISNKASIYFDYNLPIVTNTTNTVVSVEITTAVREVQNDEMKMKLGPNPSNGYSVLQISGKLKGKFELRMIDANGRIISQQTITRNSTGEIIQLPLNLQLLSSGVYYLQLQQKEKSWWQKIVLQ